MEADTSCNLSDDEAIALKVRKIVDAELRLPPEKRKIGPALAAIGKVLAGIESDIKPSGF